MVWLVSDSLESEEYVNLIFFIFKISYFRNLKPIFKRIDMVDQITDFIELIQIILMILGTAGIVVLLFGIFRKQKHLIIKGGYIIVLAAVLYGCGYLILQTTKKRSVDYLNNTYIEIDR